MTQATKTVTAGVGIVGAMTGLAIGITKGTKTAGVIGLFLVGAILGGAVGYGIASAIP